MMKLAIAEKMRPDNPCRSIERNAEKPRDRWLHEDELLHMVEALAAVNTPLRRTDPLPRRDRLAHERGAAAQLGRSRVLLGGLLCRTLKVTKAGRQDRQFATDAAALIDRQEHRLGFVFSNSAGRYPIDYKAVWRRSPTSAPQPGSSASRRTSSATRRPPTRRSPEACPRAARGLRRKTLTMTAVYVSRAKALGRKGAERAAGRINIFQKPAAEIVDLKP